MLQTGHRKPVLWNNPDDRVGGGGEGGSGRADTCIPVTDSRRHMAKTITIM